MFYGIKFRYFERRQSRGKGPKVKPDLYIAVHNTRGRDLLRRPTFFEPNQIKSPITDANPASPVRALETWREVHEGFDSRERFE